MQKSKISQSHRQQKVAHLIHVVLIDVLRKGRMVDARLIGCPLTITKVTVTADLKIAHCYFVPFNTQLSIEELTEALTKSQRSIRSSVTQEVQLKYSPELKFFYDTSFENAQQVDIILKRLQGLDSQQN